MKEFVTVIFWYTLVWTLSGIHGAACAVAYDSREEAFRNEGIKAIFGIVILILRWLLLRFVF